MVPTEHSTFHKAVDPADFTAADEERIIEEVQTLDSELSGIDIAESPDGVAELITQDEIPGAIQNEVCALIEERLSSELRSAETIVLSQRVSWLEPKYQICINFG
jgi:hypothetical protein